MSSSQLGRLLFINSNNPKYIDLIDNGTLTINKAYQHIQDGDRYTFSHGDNRNPNDFYYTPYSMTEHLLRVEDFDMGLSVCEPATGIGGITNVLEKNWEPRLITSYDVERDFSKIQRLTITSLPIHHFHRRWSSLNKQKNWQRISFASFYLSTIYTGNKGMRKFIKMPFMVLPVCMSLLERLS